MTHSYQRPGAPPTWAFLAECANGRVGMPTHREETAIEHLRRTEDRPLLGIPPYNLVLGAVVLDPDGEVAHRWGVEFDPAEPPRFAPLVHVDGWHECRRCHRELSPGMLELRDKPWCHSCVVRYVDSEERPWVPGHLDYRPKPPETKKRKRGKAESTWG